jgi:hypothetical protein
MKLEGATPWLGRNPRSLKSASVWKSRATNRLRSDQRALGRRALISRRPEQRMRAVARMTIAIRRRRRSARRRCFFRSEKRVIARRRWSVPSTGIAPDMCLAPLRRGLAPLAPWFFDSPFEGGRCAARKRRRSYLLRSRRSSPLGYSDMPRRPAVEPSFWHSRHRAASTLFLHAFNAPRACSRQI